MHLAQYQNGRIYLDWNSVDEDIIATADPAGFG
jgi:hypothetical protein